MKIEILKSAKGNEQKQNKPAKPAKSQNQGRPHVKKRQSKGKESNPKIELHT